MDYRLVAPSDEDPSAVAPREVRRILVEHGVPAQDASWLADALLALGPDDPAGRTPQSSVELSIEAIGRPYEECPSRDAALISVLLWAAYGWGVSSPPVEGVDPDRPDETERVRRLLPTWLDPSRGFDFDAGVTFLGGKLLADPNSTVGHWLGRLLRDSPLGRKRIDILRHLDLDRVRAAPSSFEFGDVDLDYRALAYWLKNAGVRTVVALTAAFEAEPGESLAALAWGIHRRLDNWLTDYHEPARARMRRWYLAMLAPAFQVLERRSNERPDDLNLASAYWLYAGCLHEVGRLSSEPSQRVLVSVRDAMGQLRARLRETPRDDAAGRAAFSEALPRYCLGAEIAARLEASIWPALKLLLLALREAPDPCVGNDLRYWLEASRDPPPAPPDPWYRLPGTLSNLVHWHVRREQAAQPDLRDLRSEFAEFCLQRLGTREKAKDRGEGLIVDQDMIEPSQVWRHCYVLALRELRSNPRRRGHRRLDWLAKNDPSPHVRRDAGAAAKELRHGVKLPDGSSPRRAIFAALWQLRQAQFLAPRGELRSGVEIDPVGARRTRQKEVQRTQEVEDAERLS